MRKQATFQHQFVEFIPEDLAEGTLYVSMGFATVVHKCCCGCGKEVVTPLSPTDWKLIFDGETISLEPSIGNWSFDCRSHYWIRRSKVRWAHRLSQEEIDAGRAWDQAAKEEYFHAVSDTTEERARRETGRRERGFWRKLRSCLP
jgi:hypothetical protein